ncbi:hypothetical protein N0V92_011012 [Colletotrichum tropicale]|nr:hypothetical protein N0V92_011012 [Colletotrichum tropicale]
MPKILQSAAHCKASICVNNCDRKADCDPGGYGKDFVTSTTCPLNVCCSKYGFCGTTEEFCGSKKVSRPSCAVEKSSKFKRVVGYYETWATGRGCNRFYPEQIPSQVYSHINLAFASINPDTFEIVPATKGDADLYKRVANLKAKDQHLKVLIAVGGWTFNDPGPTARTFSDIARSTSAQKKFFDSVRKLLKTYDLDGVDYDWEYPRAEDRSGRDEDFANFPAFLKNMKAALKGYEISITLPASYWYLQHFDLKKIAPHVDFFNMMTYDFHGVWDKPNEWVGPYLNSHTNLTEIKGGLDLLWRNGINHDKVTIGLAFYGRGFMATSPNCLSPGCTYESGIFAQACSAEVGVALNSEIDDIIAQQDAKVTLNKEAAVKIVTWGGNNWLTYDDEETLQMKADFARSQCLGGVMVWAISHDTKKAKYSMALSRVAPRLFASAASTSEDDGYITDVTEHKQCKWTNCDENCPADWIRMKRSGPGAKKNEYMVNGAGCDGRGEHYAAHRVLSPLADDGKSCPSGYKEIGSNNEYCHGLNGGFSPIRSYQAACFAYSGDGSGDAMCLGGWYRGGMEDTKKNKYCCNQPEDDKKWTDCEWQGMTDIHAFLGTVDRRQFDLPGLPDLLTYMTETYVEKMVDELLIGRPRASTIELWNTTVLARPQFSSLSYANLHDYMQNEGHDLYLAYGTTQWAHFVTCNLAAINVAISGKGGDDDGGSETYDEECINASNGNLEKRASEVYDWNPVDPFTGNTASLPWRAPDYPSPSTLNKVTEKDKFAEAYTYDPNCANFNPYTNNILLNGQVTDGYNNDHLFERQMLRIWGDDALTGALWNQVGYIKEVPFEFFAVSLQQVDASGATIQNRMMNALGSNNNRNVMTLMIQDANLLKEKVVFVQKS